MPKIEIGSWDSNSNIFQNLTINCFVSEAEKNLVPPKWKKISLLNIIYCITWHKIFLKERTLVLNPVFMGLKFEKDLRWGVFNVWIFLSFITLEIKWQFMAIMGNSTLCLPGNKEEGALVFCIRMFLWDQSSWPLRPETANEKCQTILLQFSGLPQHFKRTMKTFWASGVLNLILLTAHSIFEEVKIYYCNRDHFHTLEQEWLKELMKGNSID